MSADIVTIIAGALRDHSGDYTQDEWWICCSCGTNWFIERYSYSDAKAEYAAHQARAVLAAISEAGAVEWGIEIETRYGTARARYKTKAEADSNHPGSMPTSTVSRITGPWTAVG